MVEGGRGLGTRDWGLGLGTSQGRILNLYCFFLHLQNIDR